jgi:membrane protease YdiL (CAAX protease family)
MAGATPTDVPPVRWGLGEAAGGFLAGIFCGAITGQIAAAIVHYRPGHHQPIPLAVTITGLLGLWAGLLGGVIFASRTKGSGDLGRDFGLRIDWPKDVPLGLIAGLASQYALVPLLYLPFEQFDPGLRHRLETPAKQDTAAVHGALGITILFLCLAVGAPLVEELFFRGLLQRSLARRFGPVVAVPGSAIAFGLAHFEVLQLAALILFGLVLALLADRTGRLGPGIVAHATFNAVTVLTLTWGK